QALGAQRSVYAFDLPGVGGTDAAAGVPPVDAAVHVACDFLDSMRIRQVDVVARGRAAPAALRLLEQRRAAVRRVVLVDAAASLPAASPLTTLTAAEATPQRLVELLAPSA